MVDNDIIISPFECKSVAKGLSQLSLTKLYRQPD